MAHEEFTGVTFSDGDPTGTRISRSSEFSIANSTEIALNIPHNRETTDKIQGGSKIGTIFVRLNFTKY